MENNEQIAIKDQVIAPQSTPPVISPQGGESKKMVIWLLGGLIIVALLVGGIYYYLSNQQSAVPVATITQQPTAQTPTPPDNSPDALDKDLNAVNVANTDSDFTSLDQDLQSL